MSRPASTSSRKTHPTTHDTIVHHGGQARAVMQRGDQQDEAQAQTASEITPSGARRPSGRTKDGKRAHPRAWARSVAAERIQAPAVSIVRELPTAMLFGERGAAVERVIRVAENLDEQGAAHLAAHRAPSTPEIRSAASDWQESQQTGGGAQHAASLIASIIWARTTARVIDEDGDESLPEPWSSALGALYDAVMALGADINTVPIRCQPTAGAPCTAN